MFKMSNVIWVIVFLVVACVAGSILASVAVRRALAPALEVVTPTVQPEDVSLEPVEQAATPVPVTAVPVGTCGQTGSFVILVLADDTKIEPPFGADGVRLLRVDYDKQTLQLLSFPRNMWVVAPVQAQADLKATTLGELYQYGLEHSGKTDEAEIQAASASMVAQAIYDNFELLPDHYLVQQLTDFGILIDAIGGIDINLPSAYTTTFGQTFSAGQQHWDSATALLYIRSLGPSDTEWTRFERQDQVLRAVRASIMSSAVLSKVPELTAQFKESIVTDLSLAQVTSLSCLTMQLPAEKIEFAEIGPDMVMPGPGNYVLPDYEKIKPFLQDWLKGN